MIHQAQKLLDIFDGNRKAFGRSVPKGSDPTGGGMRVDAELFDLTIEDHLDGKQEIGIYPTWNTAGETYTKWGCCDIDTGDWSEAYALATALKAMGMQPHIERSRSKGWHIWIFSDETVTARQMRRAIKVAYAAIDLPAKEANPKSEHLRDDQVGNYVRLPYYGHRPKGKQCFMWGWDRKQDGNFMLLNDWLFEWNGTSLTDARTIIEWSERYQEPERKHIDHIGTYNDQEIEAVVGSLPGDLKLFAMSGPPHDRSGGLVALAFKLRKHGYTPDTIFNVLKVADDRWGKYSDRPNQDSFLMDIVERVI